MYSVSWIRALCLVGALGVANDVLAADGGRLVTKVDVRGNSRTKPETIVALLRREPPAHYTAAELAELERRINNLGIFDAVAVTIERDVLVVAIREKWTLIPSFDLATGTTLEDTFILLGAAEYNAFGTATFIGGEISYEQRGFNFSLAVEQHEYHPRRWAMAGEAYYAMAELYFENPDAGWVRTQAGAGISWTAPLRYKLPLGYQVGFEFYRELNERLDGEALPPDGHIAGTRMVLNWDRYFWRDLGASGYSIELEVAPSWLLRAEPGQSRHSISLTSLIALPLAKHTVLMSRVFAGLRTRGNANFSYWLGSQNGVRGLEDSSYAAWSLAFANLELRQAIPVAKRWAIQGVLFADLAAFEQIDARGGRAPAESALSTGVGARVIPTFLTQIVLRLDMCRLLVPEQNWFVQFGTSQYF
jgi:outer membrane protein assembly factor BamA